jgi:hypothetical protein
LPQEKRAWEDAQFFVLCKKPTLFPADFALMHINQGPSVEMPVCCPRVPKTAQAKAQGALASPRFSGALVAFHGWSRLLPGCWQCIQTRCH